MTASDGVILVDDLDVLQPFRAGDIPPPLYAWQVPLPPPVAAFAPGSGPAFDWEDHEPPARVPFARSALSHADVEDLGRLLGELLVARWRRETTAM